MCGVVRSSSADSDLGRKHQSSQDMQPCIIADGDADGTVGLAPLTTVQLNWQAYLRS